MLIVWVKKYFNLLYIYRKYGLTKNKLNNVLTPDDLKHWCGDTYYLNYSKFPNYSYLGEKIYTEMSTSSSPEVLKIGEQDQRTYIEKYLNK